MISMNETLVPGDGGGADWLREHLREGFVAAWSDPIDTMHTYPKEQVPNPDLSEGARLQDAGVRVKGETTMISVPTSTVLSCLLLIALLCLKIFDVHSTIKMEQLLHCWSQANHERLQCPGHILRRDCLRPCYNAACPKGAR
eukprot:SAG11_NODE_326_length_10708_cov_6.937035_3_plen_142_part_00